MGKDEFRNKYFTINKDVFKVDKDIITRSVLESKKYRRVCKETIMRICDVESAKYKSEKQVIKSVKNKLHQIYGAFVPDSDYKSAVRIIDEIGRCNESPGSGSLDNGSLDDGSLDHEGLDNESMDNESLCKGLESLKKACIGLLKMHTSTNERINFYADFYRRIFEVTGKPESILDIACGFNPFSVPWMELQELAMYYASDIDMNTVDLINKFFGAIGWPGQAKPLDVICSFPSESVHVAFVFKLLPLIERQRKGFSLELLKNIDARYIAVSFPIRSISGKVKGMLDNYSGFFENLIADDFTLLKKISFANELVYVIAKERA